MLTAEIHTPPVSQCMNSFEARDEIKEGKESGVGA
jgi:hypothetical protein